MIKDDLVKMLYHYSFKYNDKPIFKLTSGQMSNFYIDCKPVTLDSLGMHLVGESVYREIEDRIEGIGGLTFGADPIAMATAFVSGLHKEYIQAFSIRKVLKEHGTGKWIEGKVKPGNNVIIVDDVATTGGSTIKAIERAQTYGLNIEKVIILFDRQEGGVENIKKYISNVVTIVNKDDLMNYGESK